jgi:hypothetical protein
MTNLGCRVHRLTVDYLRRNRAELKVELHLLDGSPLTFTSTEMWDFAVLRLVGLAKADDMPDMSGFYPLSLPKGPGNG